MSLVKVASALTLTLLIAAGCAVRPIGTSRTSPTPSAKASPTAVVPIPVVSPAPVATGTFDPAHVVQVLGPAVAELIVRQNGGGGGIGSGFVIAHDSSASYLVTNNHVVASASKVIVLMPDGRHFTATVQGADPIQDIAVVKVTDASLPVAQFGDSTKLKVGQQVVAIGSPLGNQASVTSGIISALHRTITASAGGAAEDLPDVTDVIASIGGGGLASGVAIAVKAANPNAHVWAVETVGADAMSQAIAAGHPVTMQCYTTELHSPQAKLTYWNEVMHEVFLSAWQVEPAVQPGEHQRALE